MVNYLKDKVKFKYFFNYILEEIHRIRYFMQYQNYLRSINNLSPMQDIKYALSKSIYVIQDVKFIVVINEF